MMKNRLEQGFWHACDWTNPVSPMQTFESIERKRVPDLDTVLGRPFPVLDDGFVRVVDYMGSDEAIVQAARVSYGAGTKKVSQDRTLIRYLLRHRHTTPFEMCEIKLHVRVPMDCWRQWIRHRTANVNEYSTRYSIAIDAAQATAPDAWRLQSEANRQGSAGAMDREAGERFSRQERELHDLARRVYNDRIEAGIAREQARKDLPLSTYTEAYWKIDLSNLLHFLALRIDPNAQIEIRRYAETIGEEIVRRWVPLVWEAFRDYTLNAVQFSAFEQKILRALLSGNTGEAVRIAAELGWLETVGGKIKPNYERAEFEEKLVRMQVEVPWDRLR
jgi:thymidylate synthase (FAD)